MSIADQELAAYLLGDAPAAVRARLDALAATDPDFAAEVAALSALGTLDGVDVPSTLTPAPTSRRRSARTASRQAALAAGVLFATAGIAWGGYELLRTPPLLEDSFSSRTVSNERWEPHLGRKGVSASDGYLRLLNRGSVVTRKEFDGPIEVAFDWRWVDHAQWPLYSEVMTVCLRTGGHHKPSHAYEITDGLLVELNAVEGSVRVLRADRPGDSPLVPSIPDSAPMPPGEWHRVRIVDDGRVVSVFLEGPSIDPRQKMEPLVSAPIPEGMAGRRVAFFNREYVAGTNHESHVENVRIRAIKP